MAIYQSPTSTYTAARVLFFLSRSQGAPSGSADHCVKNTEGDGRMKHLMERSFYSACLLVLLGIGGCLAVLGQGARTRATEENCASCFQAKAFHSPEIPYEVKTDFLKLPPNLNFGEAPGVTMNSKGHIFAFTRSHG